MKKIVMSSVTILAVALAGCSSDSNGGGNPALVDNLVTQTYSQVLAQAVKATGGAGESISSSLATKQLSPRAAPQFDAFWSTTPAMNNPITYSGFITAQEYMAIQFDPTAQNNNGASVNVFGRLATALGIFCAIGVGTGMSGVATDSNGYPADGTHTVVFTPAVKATMTFQCGMDVSDMPDGTEMPITISTASGNYDKLFDLAGIQSYYIRSTSTEVSIATGELHDDGTSVSRSVVLWNKTTGVMRVQYVSDRGSAPAGNAGLYGYRLYYDETNDEAQYFAYEGPDNDPGQTQATRYIMAGKPTNGNAISWSLITPQIYSGSMVEACVNSDTGALVDDGDRCVASGTAINGAAINAGATSTMITNFYNNSGQAGWGTVSTSTSLNWTNTSNMVTVDFLHSI